MEAQVQHYILTKHDSNDLTAQTSHTYNKIWVSTQTTRKTWCTLVWAQYLMGDCNEKILLN